MKKSDRKLILSADRGKERTPSVLSEAKRRMYLSLTCR